MANTLEAAIPKILAGGLDVLRKRTVMPSLIRRDLDDEAAQRGDTIDLWDRETPDVRDVSPSNTPPTTGDTTLAKTQVTLDSWKEAPFYMTDKDILEVVEDGVIPDQISKAAKKLAEQINQDIMGTYYRIYESVGSAGSVAFDPSDTPGFADASAARRVLNTNEVPMDMRRMVVSPEAEENAINASEFADASFADDDSVIVQGDIGRKLGFDWVMDQQVPSHTVGSLSSVTVDGAQTAGIQNDSIPVSGTSISLNQGDIITFSNHTQSYAVTEAISSTSNEIQIEPALQQDLAGGESVSLDVTTDHTVNLAFHQNAFGLAVRPIADADLEDVAITRTMQDPVTGIPLRVEVTREHKRTQWSFDILYGTQSIDPRLAVRVLGA